MPAKVTTGKVMLPNGERMFYRQCGVGSKKVLMLHGNFASSLYMKILMEKFPEEEYTVYAPDLRAFGETTNKKPIETTADYAQDLKYFLDAIGVEKCILCGWSLGGIVAMHFTAMFPESVEKIIMLANGSTQGFFALYTDIMPRNGKYIDRNGFSIVYQNLQPFNLPIMFDFLVNTVKNFLYAPYEISHEKAVLYARESAKQRDFVRAAYAACAFNISDRETLFSMGSNELNKINCPVLIFRGTKDGFVVPGETEVTMKDLAHCNPKLIEIEGGGHGIIESHTDFIFEEIEKFIKG